uniref:AIG1-type G domain-containing protein n=1 Tax=Hucho hucho TaxID=62062 RepID=A0A4W5KW06_9TELE
MAASGLHTPSGDSLHFSELRIVLLGYRGGSGKSSAGNTILGREEFDLKTTAQCVKKQGEVAGRQVTVVDTPGWWKNLPVERTPELVKQEILLSVSLCPPGPHTFLLVISVGFLYSEEDRRAVEEHLTLLSETVWSHTIVLFTRGDCLGDTTVEQHIESEGEALQWLVEKCGNRYHILNNENRGDATQVTELLEKIEEMVAGNRGGHFEIKRELLEKIEVWRRKKEDKAKQLCMRVKKQREIHRTFIGDSLYLSELRIVLLGSRDAGKSSAGNTILGREEFDLRTAAQCVKRQGEVAGRQVTVVDTPGWWKNLPVEYTPELVKQEIVFSASLCHPGPHTLFLVIRVDVSFKEEETNAAEDHLELLSETVWSHTIVLFTHGDCLGDTTIEQHIQREGKALQWLVEKCGNRFHVLNNNNRGDVTQVTELLEKIDELVAANSGDVFYPERDCEEGMNWIPEEMWEKPSLPLKGAHSIYYTYYSEEEVSGGSRPETGYDGSDQMSGFGSVAESLLRLVVPGDDISDTQSLRSSVYSSQTSEPVCEHNSGSSSRAESSLDFMSLVVRRIFCSQKNPCTSGTSNPESQHSSTSTPEEHTLAVVTKLTPETSTEFTETSCRLQCSHAGLFQCSLTGLVFLMEGEGEVLYRTVQWDENLLHSTGQTPAGPLFSIECPQGSICQLHLPHCEILSGEGLDSL